MKELFIFPVLLILLFSTPAFADYQKGVYQHAAKKHLHLYAVEFEFRYNYRIRNGYNDMDRTAMILKGIEGKRLTYQISGQG